MEQCNKKVQKGFRKPGYNVWLPIISPVSVLAVSISGNFPEARRNGFELRDPSVAQDQAFTFFSPQPKNPTLKSYMEERTYL